MSEKINLDKFCDRNEEENEKRQMEIYKKVIDEVSYARQTLEKKINLRIMIMKFLIAYFN